MIVGRGSSGSGCGIMIRGRGGGSSRIRFSLPAGGANLYAYADDDPVDEVDPSGLYPYSLFQLAAIVYNETSSLSGPGINAARLDIAYVALNRPNPGGVAPDVFTRPAITAITYGNHPAMAAFISSLMAAQCALTYPQDDPTHGALGYNFRWSPSKLPRSGAADVLQQGPFTDSYPRASGVCLNVYTH